MLVATSFSACADVKEKAYKAYNKKVIYEIAFIPSDVVLEKGTYENAIWEGLIEYGEESGKAHKYFASDQTDTEGYLTAIANAAGSGAKVIITQSKKLEKAVNKAQKKYPEVKFIHIAGSLNENSSVGFKPLKNTMIISFADEQAGFLAGYAAVKDEEWKLGFMGCKKNKTAMDYATGFVQGAEAAADEMGVSSVNIKYWTVKKTPDAEKIKKTAANWYKDSVDIIFACGEEYMEAVSEAANDGGGRIIAAETNAAPEYRKVYTSAMRNFAGVIKYGLQKYCDDHFPGGKHVRFNAVKDAVCLPLNDFSFKDFSEEDYDMIYDRLSKNIIKVKDSKSRPAEALDLQIVNLDIV